jgi:hypothetical protein
VGGGAPSLSSRRSSQLRVMRNRMPLEMNRSNPSDCQSFKRFSNLFAWPKLRSPWSSSASLDRSLQPASRSLWCCRSPSACRDRSRAVGTEVTVLAPPPPRTHALSTKRRTAHRRGDPDHDGLPREPQKAAPQSRQMCLTCRFSNPPGIFIRRCARNHSLGGGARAYERCSGLSIAMLGRNFSSGVLNLR